MTNKSLPSVESLRESLSYDPDSGLLTWKERPREMFASEAIHRSWNTRRAGTPALNHMNHNGYLVGLFMGKGIRAHRAAWAIHYGEWPKDQIDHVNGIKTDNRISNLREASQSENKRNTRTYSNNKCGLKGVHWHKINKAWVARIGYMGRQISLGKFETAEDAHQAYCEAAKFYHGEFARTK